MSPGCLSFKIRLTPLAAADGGSSSSLNSILSFVGFFFPTALYLPRGVTHRPVFPPRCYKERNINPQLPRPYLTVTSHYIKNRNSKTEAVSSRYQWEFSAPVSPFAFWPLGLWKESVTHRGCSPHRDVSCCGFPRGCTGHSLGISRDMLKQYRIPHKNTGTLTM